jgi:hypothetical protein
VDECKPLPRGAGRGEGVAHRAEPHNVRIPPLARARRHFAAPRHLAACVFGEEEPHAHPASPVAPVHVPQRIAAQLEIERKV